MLTSIGHGRGPVCPFCDTRQVCKPKRKLSVGMEIRLVKRGTQNSAGNDMLVEVRKLPSASSLSGAKQKKNRSSNGKKIPRDSKSQRLPKASGRDLYVVGGREGSDWLRARGQK